MFVWSHVSNQLRVAGMEGVPFAPDHNAIWTFMDKYKIKRQTHVFEKVIYLFSYFIKEMRSQNA